MRPHDFTHEKQRINIWFERWGLERTGRVLTQMPPPGADPEARRFRTEAWMRDSLLWSIEEFEAGRHLYAFRGYVQACGYAGELGGWGHEQDTRSALHNAIEDVIRGAERATAELEEILGDAREERGLPRRSS